MRRAKGGEKDRDRKEKEGERKRGRKPDSCRLNTSICSLSGPGLKSVLAYSVSGLWAETRREKTPWRYRGQYPRRRLSQKNEKTGQRSWARVF